MSVCVVGAAALVSSCGGGSKGGAGETAVDGGDGAAVQCPPPTGAEAEPPPEPFVVDGGVPLDEYPRALAVARCSYWGRCFGLATYAVNECIATMVSSGTWSYFACQGDFFGPNLQPQCSGTTGTFNLGARADVLKAAMAGTAHYDAQRAGQCIAALLNEGCAYTLLIENLPACTGVFSCLSDAGPTDGGPSDGGASSGDASDGGTVCSEINLLYSATFTTCSTDDECAGDKLPGGPHCVGGICSPSACGVGLNMYCTTFAQVGQPCQDTASSFIYPTSPTPTATCAPGLACQYATADAGMGTCIVIHDVGAPCSLSTDCKPGLSCTCGTCAIPPSSGPAVDHRCKIGVAYFDYATNQCKPVLEMGANCNAAITGCRPGLTCDAFSTCQLPTL